MNAWASARQMRPALALAASFCAAPAVAQSGPVEERRVHAILAVQEQQLAGAMMRRDVRDVVQSMANIVGEVERTGKLGKNETSPCRRAASLLARLAGAASVILRGGSAGAGLPEAQRLSASYGAAMGECAARAGVRPNAQPPFEIFLRHLGR